MSPANAAAGSKRKAADDASSNKKPRADGNIAAFFGAKTGASSSGGGGGGGGGSSGGTTSAFKGNASASAPAEPPMFKFNKQQWLAKLSDEQRELLRLEIDTLHESWLGALADELVSASFLELKRFLRQEKERGVTVYPPEQDIYSWSRYTPLNTVKAVILGQDPYHGPNQAHGLCFSTRPPTPAPPSLKNIYVALKHDYPEQGPEAEAGGSGRARVFRPPPPQRGGLLTPWAERGVLLLNACLTVRAHTANSHEGRGWERLTQRVIDTVARVRTRGVVFMAWGNAAAKRVAKVNRSRHLVLQSVHPSPLSASRGFFECGHFRKANEWLAQRYGPDGEIDWNLGDEPAAVEPAKEKAVNKAPPAAAPAQAAAAAAASPPAVAASAAEAAVADAAGSAATTDPSSVTTTAAADDDDDGSHAVETVKPAELAEPELEPKLDQADTTADDGKDGKDNKDTKDTKESKDDDDDDADAD